MQTHDFQPTHDNYSKWEYLVVLLVGVIYFLVAAWPGIQSEWIVCEDTAQHYIWLYDYSWPEPDHYSEVAKVIQPWGYQLLLQFLSLFISPHAITTWMPLLGLLLTMGFAFMAVRGQVNLPLALTIALLIGHMAYPEISGFFARAFCVPILVAFWALASRGFWRATAILVLVSSLFYPPSTLIIMGAMSLLFLWSLANRSSFTFPGLKSMEFRYLLGAGGLAFLIMLSKSWSVQQHPSIGPFHDRTFIEADAAFGRGGRVQFQWEMKTPTPVMLRYTLNKCLKLPNSRLSLQLLGGCFLMIMTLFRRQPFFRPLRVVLILLVSASLGHSIAKVLAPQLFLPDRFLSYPGAFFAAVLVWTPIAGLLLGLTQLLNKYWKLARTIGNIRLQQFPAILLGTVFLIGVLKWMPDNPKVTGRSIDDFSRLAGVFEITRTLPENALLFGPPNVMDPIPFLGKRMVYLNNELSHALYFREYYKIVNTRWKAFLSTFFVTPENADGLIEFLKNEQITHLLFDAPRLKAGKVQAFRPYGIELEALKETAPPESWLLNQLPRRIGRTIDERYRLISTEELMEYLAEE